MDEDLPSFPHHCDVKTYLEKYLDYYNLSKFVQLGKQVEQVLPVPTKLADSFDSVKWSVTTQNLANGQRKTEEFDSVLICNG